MKMSKISEGNDLKDSSVDQLRGKKNKSPKSKNDAANKPKAPSTTATPTARIITSHEKNNE